MRVITHVMNMGDYLYKEGNNETIPTRDSQESGSHSQ